MSTPKSKHAPATRATTAIWLVGHPLSSIDEPSLLPASGVALRRLFYEIKTNNATLPTACSTVAEEVMSFWVKANIETTEKPHVVAKLKGIHQEHIRVSKNKHRRSETQVGLEIDFELNMSKLFDIAHADWERRSQIAEDRQFLIDQRGPRQMTMTDQRGPRQMTMTTEDHNYKHAAEKYLNQFIPNRHL